jgi:hypothetical protein
LIHVTRVGCFALLAVILAGGDGGEAIAKAGKGRLHRARSSTSDAYATLPGWGTPSPRQQARPGSMHYYGGPKSSMWRNPAED